MTVVNFIDWANVTEERIAERAYQLFLERQRDRARQDWLDAERELKGPYERTDD